MNHHDAYKRDVVIIKTGKLQVVLNNYLNRIAFFYEQLLLTSNWKLKDKVFLYHLLRNW